MYFFKLGLVEQNCFYAPSILGGLSKKNVHFYIVKTIFSVVLHCCHVIKVKIKGLRCLLEEIYSDCKHCVSTCKLNREVIFNQDIMGLEPRFLPPNSGT